MPRERVPGFAFRAAGPTFRVSGAPGGGGVPAAGARVAIAGAAALAAAVLWQRRTRTFDLRGKVVLVTGGSRGLGLVLARALVRRGACVALMARQPQELARAVESLGDNENVLGVAGDVRLPESCTRVVEEVVRRFGRLDVLINNAGVILSAPLARTGIDDFQTLMDVHFWGTIHMTSAALPHLLEHRGARVANICSIGGKVAVPHLSAYCASKFAQAGLSSILTEELRQHGVVVTTIYPGLMRTGSHLHAGFKGDTPREFRLFALAAGSPVTAISAERAARRILAAIERGQADLTFPGSMWLAARVSALMPNVTAELLALVSRLLPDGKRDSPPAAAVRPIRGDELPLSPAVRAAIILGERAALRNNERVATAP